MELSPSTDLLFSVGAEAHVTGPGEWELIDDCSGPAAGLFVGREVGKAVHRAERTDQLGGEHGQMTGSLSGLLDGQRPTR
jgi:hypothetical protein